MISTVSSELFFNETEFQIIIPNVPTDKKDLSFHDITSAKPRDFAFYDEQLRVYLFARLPAHIAGAGDEEVASAVQSFFKQLDVHIDASMTDATFQTNTSSPIQHRSVSLKHSSSTSLSNASSPKLPQHKVDTSRGPVDAPFFYSHTYSSRGDDQECITAEENNAYCCLFPLTIPIVYVKARGSHPQLSVSCNISYRPLPPARNTKDTEKSDESEYDPELFESVDLLGGLTGDPFFANAEERPMQRFMVEVHSRMSSSSFIQPSSSSPRSLTLRRHTRCHLPVRSSLIVKMRTTNASVADKMVMMSVELENPGDVGCPFQIEKIDVQVSNAVVAMAFTKESPFPVLLNSLDQIVFLYNVTLLEDGVSKPPIQPQRMFPSRRAATQPVPVTHHQDERLQPQRVTIQVCGAPIVDGVKTLPMQSKWNTMLDVMGMRQKREEAPPDPRFASLLASSTSPLMNSSEKSRSTSATVSPGAHSVASPVSQMNSLDGMAAGKKRLVINMGPSVSRDAGAHRAPEVEIADGIVVSLTVPNSIIVGKIFPLHIFIVNRSKHTRRFQVMIPNRKRNTSAVESFNNTMKTGLPLLPMEQRPIDPFMDEAEFLRQYFENETHEADIVCLENNVRLSPLGPSTSQTVDIRFIAVKDNLHTIDLIQLVDQDTGFVTNLRHVLEVFVEPC
ncbi:TRAPP trafficking subunit Trs65-domain-containing protein [Radiomyces spectabilis]|uniref:TRAPP trafficking subunit Trs65-domain-containing protein n=1 Tax=Radiomyces spectabilis TaxID=64574 RepID=UPI00221ECBE8|nr:TRAPP trafficking subunit Trs65-domain-containing protein [Radiomyces spectabilis]KAI8388018.1 TRAPP trafficking subunit Trs65-domain-containing protein [Radiomyces spectabilis]